MPYMCTSCGRYQQGHSADGICPASECQPARQAKHQRRVMASVGRDEAMRAEGRALERARVVAWLRDPLRMNLPTPTPGMSLVALADALEAGEHLS